MAARAAALREEAKKKRHHGSSRSSSSSSKSKKSLTMEKPGKPAKSRDSQYMYASEQKKPKQPIQNVDSTIGTTKEDRDSKSGGTAGALTTQRQQNTQIGLGSHAANARNTIAMFLCGIAIIVGVLLFARWVIYAPTVAFCDTPGCLRHVEEIKAAMDPSVDPCEDFYKFTCGSWKPVRKEKSMIARIYEHSLDIAMQEMSEAPDEAVVPAAPQYYQSCISPRTEIDTELEIFKMFKRDIGLMWPEDTQGADFDPLVLLLNLSINWNFHLFFNLRAFPVYRRRRQTLYIRRGFMNPNWQDLTRPEQWRANVKEHCSLLKAKVPDSTYTELEGVVKDLMSAAISIPPDATNDTQFELKIIEHFIQPGSHWWLRQLNQFHSPEYEWTPDSPVALEDETILVKLDRLLKDYSDKKAALLVGFSWAFIQRNLWLIAGKPELIQRGDPSALEKFMAKACLNYVQSHFGLIISAKHIYARYNFTVRNALRAFFDTLLKQVRHMFMEARWIDDGVKERALNKLSELGFNAMPDDKFFSKIDLNRLYKDFPRIRGPFVENFIGIAKAYRRVIGHDSFVSIFSKRLGGGDASRYNYYYNVAFLSIGAMEPPIFYGDGTLSMQYGTLGTMLAQLMVRSFDSRGAYVNEKGDNDAWWRPSQEHHNRINCDLLHGTGGSSEGPGSRVQSALFPSVTGLGISFQAYREAVALQGASTVDQLRLEGLELFTDDQVFYLTYCLSTCAINSNGRLCNVPLRHSSRFSNTFKCAAGTPMNPAKKCVFFS